MCDSWFIQSDLNMYLLFSLVAVVFAVFFFFYYFHSHPSRDPTLMTLHFKVWLNDADNELQQAQLFLRTVFKDKNTRILPQALPLVC